MTTDHRRRVDDRRRESRENEANGDALPRVIMVGDTQHYTLPLAEDILHHDAITKLLMSD